MPQLDAALGDTAQGLDGPATPRVAAACATRRERISILHGPESLLRSDTAFGLDFRSTGSLVRTTIALTAPNMEALAASAASASAQAGIDGGTSFGPLLERLADDAPSLGADVQRARVLAADARDALSRGHDSARILVDWASVELAFLNPDQRVGTHARSVSRVSFVVQPPGGATEVKASVCEAGGLARIGAARLEAAAREVEQLAERLAGTQPTPPGRHRIVLSPQASGVLIHEAAGHLLEADNYARLVDQRGRLRQQLGSDALTVWDAGATGGRWGSLVVDDEGYATTVTPLLVQGTSAGLVTDTRWADQLALPRTGHGRRAWQVDTVLPRIARITIEPGDADAGELHHAVDNGLYILSFGEGGLDARSGMVTLRIREARGIRHGELAERYSGGMVRAHAGELLRAVEAVGTDLEWHPAMCLKQGQVVPVENGGATMLMRMLEVT